MIYKPAEASRSGPEPAAFRSRGRTDPFDEACSPSQPSDPSPMSPDPRPPAPCSHLAAYRASSSATPLRSLRGCLRARPPGHAEVVRGPCEVPRCGPCADEGREGEGARLYACLACAGVCCPAHAQAHARARGTGHEIAVDVDRAELFCLSCRDQIYDRDFDAAVVLALSSPSASSPPPPEAMRKRRRVEYRPWIPDPMERELMDRGSTPLLNRDGNASGSASGLGLRGLNNLGSTCFMNSVLQALLHAPPLRNYFLSDRHSRYVCQQSSRRRRSDGGGNGRDKGTCLVCDLDAIYSAAFSGDRIPYSPARFLYSWWQHASNLASYEQQDAHEFFISMLDAIHEKVVEDQQNSQNQGNGDCCIAHRVFSGILRSDVMCTICGFTSTTYDPCVDISLDLDYGQDSAKVVSRSHTSNGNIESMLTSESWGISTLRGCLERFTRPERLGSDQKFFCQHCQVRQESLKQMSMRKLPLVTCFHIKRFEHSPVRKMSRKLDRYLQFPFSLNMAPYLSSSILRSRFGNRIFTFDGDDSGVSTELASEFELFAVITHSGKLDAGHYITFLRLNNQWYKCDDAWITHVTESIVRASQAYMLFYVQKMLYYKASEDVVVS